MRCSPRLLCWDRCCEKVGHGNESAGKRPICICGQISPPRAPECWSAKTPVCTAKERVAPGGSSIPRAFRHRSADRLPPVQRSGAKNRGTRQSISLTGQEVRQLGGDLFFPLIAYIFQFYAHWSALSLELGTWNLILAAPARLECVPIPLRFVNTCPGSTRSQKLRIVRHGLLVSKVVEEVELVIPGVTFSPATKPARTRRIRPVSLIAMPASSDSCG